MARGVVRLLRLGYLKMVPSKYNKEAAELMRATSATGVVVLVFGGREGNGAAIQITPAILENLPAQLRIIANDLENGRAGFVSIKRRDL